MVKRCCWGTCDSDTRYPDRLKGGIFFVPFPKPARNMEKCLRWIRLCGRPCEQLNVVILGDPTRNKHVYVCSKHFVNGQPSKEYPDPTSALHYDQKITPTRAPPKQRAFDTEQPPTKKCRTQLMQTFRPDVCDENADGTEVSNKAGDHTYVRRSSSMGVIREPMQCISMTEPMQCASTTEPMQCASTTEPTQCTSMTEPVHCTSMTDFEGNKENLRDGGSIDVLALAASNESLKQQVAKLILENENLLRSAANGSKDLPRSVKTNNSKPIMGVNMLKVTKKTDEFIYYTGLKNEQFNTLYNFLVPGPEKPFTYSKKMSAVYTMSMQDQLLLVLMKLRQNFDNVHLGRLFQLSGQDVSTLFTNWIQYMFFRCGSVSIWPHRDIIIHKMPKDFKQNFPTTLIIIDGTEIKIQRPSSLTRQSQCYSDYKSSTTLKGFVGIDPRGSIIFSSMLFTGAISDKELTEKCGFYTVLAKMMDCNKIHKGDGVMADKGFRIEEELSNLGLKLNIPPFARCSAQMSSSDAYLTEKIARHRVHVERAIARVKQFKILKNKIDLTMFSCINQIWFVCCFITNFMPFLIKE